MKHARRRLLNGGGLLRVAAPPPALQRDNAHHLCVVLHDVSPHNWQACARLLRHLRTIAADAGMRLPVTLLVVPPLNERTGDAQRYIRWLQRRVQAGHELALQGLAQCDGGGMAALDRVEAAARLAGAQRWAEHHGVPLPGFVAPHWRLGCASLDAVADRGFSYSGTPDQVLALPERQALQAHSRVFCSRSALHRALLVAWNSLRGWRTQAPLLRIELHPADGEHEAVRACWTRLLSQALQDRPPLRLSEAAALARGVPGRARGGTPSAAGGA